MSRSFSGPLPPPEILVKYNEVLPGAAERIVAMAEKQQSHRQDLERKLVFSNAESQVRGSYLGFVVCMTVVLGGFYLLYLGRQITGIIAVVTPLIGLVSVFVYGKHAQQKDLNEKAKPANASKK